MQFFVKHTEFGASNSNSSILGNSLERVDFETAKCVIVPQKSSNEAVHWQSSHRRTNQKHAEQ